MGRGDLEDYTAYPKFQRAMIRLGWLSSYSRQIILVRHLLRTLDDFDVVSELTFGEQETLLDVFRVSITTLSGVNAKTKQFSAPYVPHDRPNTHFLAFARRRHIFETSIASGLPSIEIFGRNSGIIGFENSTVEAVEDELLIREIDGIAAGVSLATKSIADERAEVLAKTKLWGTANVLDWQSASHGLKSPFFLKPQWDFWVRWYAQIWDGTFRDWDLAIEVALIPDDVWEGEDALAKVAEVIREIEDRRRTAIAVPLVRNEVDTAFELDSEAPLSDEMLDFIKQRVGGALDTALKASGANVFDENCPEALAISQALRSTNPSAVAGLLNDASLMFQTNLGDRYPPNEGSLIALQVAAFTGAEEICETDEVARARCLRASQLYLRENAQPVDPKELEEFTKEIAREAEGEAKEIIENDGRAIASGKRVGRFVRARFANYASTIVQWIDKAKKGDARVSWLWKKVRELMDMFGDPPDGV
ncbi:MAG: hypothetical protein AAF601_04270 [Pseudomonadota bacterium]